MPEEGGSPTGAGSLLNAQQMDEILEAIESGVKKVDANQASVVRLRKAELDLLHQLEVARDAIRQLLSSGNRGLLREIFAGDCSRVARLRAALGAVQFSEMNARDQRFPTCEEACRTLEEIVGKDFGLGAQLVQETSRKKRTLIQARATVCMIDFGAPVAENKPEAEPPQGAPEGTEVEDALEAAVTKLESLPQAKKAEVDDEDDDEDDEPVEAPPEESAEEQEAFATFVQGTFADLDKNGDGTVTMDELKGILQKSRDAMKDFAKVMRLRNRRDVEKFMKEADTDNDGRLDFEEFRMYLVRLRERSVKRVIDEDVIKGVFESFDKNGDHTIDVSELKCAYAGILLSAGQPVNPKRVTKWAKRNLKKFDGDASRTLDYTEFKELLLRSGGLANLIAPAADGAA